MFFAPRERFGPLRAGTAVLAAANLAVAAGTLLTGLVGGVEVASISTATPLDQEPVATAAPATVLAASLHPLLATTTTAAPAAPPHATGQRARAAASAPPSTTGAPTSRVPPARDGDDEPRADDGADTRRVVSTGYCLDGPTTSGVDAGPGMAAMNGVALGSRWLVHDGPFGGATLEITDRIGHSTEFDIWFAECADAVAYGRRTITIERVG